MKKTATEAARTRQAVLAAATQSFAEQGWDGSTLDGIGRRAGLTRGAVVHHFGDKKTLLWAVLREGWATQSERLLLPLDDTTLDPPLRLVGFLTNLLDQLAADPELRALSVVNTLVAPFVRDRVEDLDEHRMAVDVWHLRLDRVIRGCRLRPDVTARDTLFGLMASIVGSMQAAAIEPATLPDRRRAKAVATGVLRGWLADL